MKFKKLGSSAKIEKKKQIEESKIKEKINHSEKKGFLYKVSKKMKELKKSTKIIIVLLIVIVILCLVLGVANSETGKLKITAESSLEKIVEKNDLETVSYTYNAIAKQPKNADGNVESENNDDYKYFVSYEGMVSAGIDFKQVKIDIDRKAKKLIIIVPEPKITGYNVDIGSLKFIFTKEKYNEASELESAFKLCKEDLENRSEKDELILKTAKQNSITVLEAFFKPWIETLNNEYEVEIK